MKYIYTLLYTLSIILINPWGITRGYIWTVPKVLVIWLIIGFNIAIIWENRKDLTITQHWKNGLILWIIFLAIGAISTIHSPFPSTSFWGQNQMGDGWLYWIALALFTLSNTLLLKLHPQLLSSQLQGMLIGGIILAMSTIPQILDWRIDYTATMGQIIRADVNASSIFQGQQPIGLYSHRGHAAIALATIALISIIGWLFKLTSDRLTAIALIIIAPALIFTSTRAAILGLVTALFYELGRKYYKLILGVILISAIALCGMTFTRPLDWSQPSVQQVISSRSPMWALSLRGIKKRPFFGWGFDGFGIAYPYIRNPKKTPIVVSLDEFTYDYITINEQVSTREIPTYKAHNLILDTTLSIGILGLISYAFLWGYYIYLAIESSFRGMEAIAIAYLIFSLTWFDSAQYAHIPWWTLSIGAAFLTSKFDCKLSPPLKQSQVAIEYALLPTKKRLITKKIQLQLFAGLLAISLIGIYYLANANTVNRSLVKLKATLFPKNLLGCGSPSGGPQDNPIASRYGKQAYSWTDEIKWSCVYNINDFSGSTLIDRYNFALDVAAANGGGVIYFPAAIYEFTDNIYLKNGIIIRGETPDTRDAFSSTYSPPTKFIFPKYEPNFSGLGTPNSTAFKKIYATFPNADSNIGIVNVDINRAGIYILANIDTSKNQNIVIYGIRSNNVADPIPWVPYQDFQAASIRYSDPRTANIKINAYANVLVSNNRLNDAITDNYPQPNYNVTSDENWSDITYLEPEQVPFLYGNHFGIVVNRFKGKGFDDDFTPNATPEIEPGLFRKGIAIRDNWIYHTMKSGIRASGEGLTIENNIIRDEPVKQWWTDETGTRLATEKTTFGNRAIEWAGWNVLIQENEYQVYRHQLLDLDKFSNDGGGIVTQECCGGTGVKNVEIVDNVGNSYIGIYKVPFIQGVRIAKNKLLDNVKGDWPLIYDKDDTEKRISAMEDVIVENNTIEGSVLAVASKGGSGNIIRNNKGLKQSTIKYSCHVSITGNSRLIMLPCLNRNQGEIERKLD